LQSCLLIIQQYFYRVCCSKMYLPILGFLLASILRVS
jgi:hypothetical protein